MGLNYQKWRYLITVFCQCCGAGDAGAGTFRGALEPEPIFWLVAAGSRRPTF